MSYRANEQSFDIKPWMESTWNGPCMFNGINPSGAQLNRPGYVGFNCISILRISRHNSWDYDISVFKSHLFLNLDITISVRLCDTQRHECSPRFLSTSFFLLNFFLVRYTYETFSQFGFITCNGFFPRNITYTHFACYNHFPISAMASTMLPFCAFSDRQFRLFFSLSFPLFEHRKFFERHDEGERQKKIVHTYQILHFVFGACRIRVI